MYFFLSYAHTDPEDDQLVLQLFRDIRRDMQAFAGRKERDRHGFLDTANIGPGDQWSFELTEALATCQVFVALCGPPYFESEQCGREWQIFSHRVRLYERQTGRRANALIPLTWVPMDMPEIATRYQYRGPELGEVYGNVGVRELALMVRYHDDYRQFVSGLTRRILAVRQNCQIPEYPEPRDFETIESAFHPPRTTTDRGTDAGPEAAATPTADPSADVNTASNPSRAGGPPPDRPILSTIRRQPGNPAGLPRQVDRSTSQDGKQEPAAGSVA